MLKNFKSTKLNAIIKNSSIKYSYEGVNKNYTCEYKNRETFSSAAARKRLTGDIEIKLHADKITKERGIIWKGFRATKNNKDTVKQY